MALNRYQPKHSFFGFDDFFAPVPFLRDPFEAMPVLRNFENEAGSTLLRASPGFEISELDGNYQISVDVPGVKASDMNVELENDGRVLHISGGRKVTRDGTTSETKFEKKFTIGKNVDVQKMTANLADGVLVLKAPKIEPKEPPKFSIPITEGPRGEEKKED
jgi:HSP20 family protein